MKKQLLLLLALLAIAAAATGPARAQSTSSLEFTETYANGGATANDNVVWTVTSDGSESTFDNTKGIHYGTNKAQVQYIELSTSGISGTITQVVVNAAKASGVDATVSVTVGDNAFGNAQSMSSNDPTDYTFTGSASGAIVVRVAKPEAAAKALYVKSIEVTYTSGGGSTWVRDGDEWDEATKTLTVNSNPEEEAYSGRDDIENLVISDAVTSIGESAFSYCTGLTSVTFGNSVTSIGLMAFAGCTGLTSITIPNSVTSIGDFAFYGCSNLETVTIHAESLDSYESDAFEDTAEGLKIYVPAGSVDTYKAGWDDDADKIEAIVVERVLIGDLYYNLKNDNKTAEVTYKSHADYSFNEGWDITTANIPASVEYNSVTYSVTSIGQCAFQSCTGLKSITIGNSVTSIGSEAFNNCTGLTSVTIGNSVTSIGKSAFESCSGLTSIEIPNSVTSIGNYAFNWCTGLTSVTIPNSVTSIGDYAFRDCI